MDRDGDNHGHKDWILISGSKDHLEHQLSTLECSLSMLTSDSGMLDITVFIQKMKLSKILPGQ